MLPLELVKDHVIVVTLGLLTIEQVRVVDWPTAILVCVADTLTSGGTVTKDTREVHEMYLAQYCINMNRDVGMAISSTCSKDTKIVFCQVVVEKVQMFC